MAENKARGVVAISQTAARLSFAGAAAFTVLLAALHFIKPELDPSWHFISEYAIGEYGWIMLLAFLSLALGYASPFFAICSQLRTVAGRIGLTLLLVSALGLTIAAIFTEHSYKAYARVVVSHAEWSTTLTKQALTRPST